MKYAEAAKIRKIGLKQLITDNLVDGKGVRESITSALSSKNSARWIALKEAFDPLGLIKFLTGGSELATAFAGNIMGRSKEDINYFTKGSKRPYVKRSNYWQKLVNLPDEKYSGKSLKVLRDMHSFMIKTHNEEQKEYEIDKLNDMDQSSTEERQHNEIIDIFIQATKKRTQAEKQMRKGMEKKEKEYQKREKELDKREKRIKKSEEGEVKKPKQEPYRDPKTGRFTTKPETDAAQQTVRKVEVPTPKPTAASIITPTVSTAVKVGAVGAVAVGGLMASKEAAAKPKEHVARAIDTASKTVGVDRSILYAIVNQESKFDPSATAGKSSSAKGLFQFVTSTWKYIVDKYSKQYPTLKGKQPTDPEANALAGALYIKESMNALKRYGLPVNATNIYAAHFLGPSGAKKLLTSDPNSDASKLFPKSASSNENIFYKDGKSRTQPRTSREVVQILFEKVGAYEQKYAEILKKIPRQGESISEKSVAVADAKKEMGQQFNIITPQYKNTTNIFRQKVVVAQANEPDINPILGR